MSKKALYFTLGTLFGTASGILAGMLLAPRSGAESRAMAADAMNDVSDSAVDTYERGAQTAADKFSGVRPIVDAKTDELRAKVDLARERMDQLRDSLSDVVTTTSAQVQDAVNAVADQVAAARRGRSRCRDSRRGRPRRGRRRRGSRDWRRGLARGQDRRLPGRKGLSDQEGPQGQEEPGRSRREAQQAGQDPHGGLCARTAAELVGFLVARPDVVGMVKREDAFLAWDSFRALRARRCGDPS